MNEREQRLERLLRQSKCVLQFDVAEAHKLNCQMPYIEGLLSDIEKELEAL